MPPASRIMFAASIIGVFGLLRSSEFLDKAPYGCTLLRGNIEVLGDRAIILLTRSKTDDFNTGVKVSLFRNSGSLCPVRWISWALASAKLKKRSDPVFQDADGRAVTYKAFHLFLKLICARLGLDTGNISSHSLRIGGATSLIELGVDIATVKAIGRWASECYLVYVRLSEQTFRSAASALARAADERHAPIFCGMDLPQFAALSKSQINRFKRHRKV
jgi:hypothetical protein